MFCAVFPATVVILVLRDALPLFFITSYVLPVIPELRVSSEDRNQRAGFPRTKREPNRFQDRIVPREPEVLEEGQAAASPKTS